MSMIIPPCQGSLPAAWVVRDNKWRATRYGLDAVVITDDSGTTQGLDVIFEVLDQGVSYERQRALMADGGELEDVVDALVTEFAEDHFVGSREVAHGRA